MATAEDKCATNTHTPEEIDAKFMAAGYVKDNRAETPKPGFQCVRHFNNSPCYFVGQQCTNCRMTVGRPGVPNEPVSVTLSNGWTAHYCYFGCEVQHNARLVGVEKAVASIKSEMAAVWGRR